MKNRYQSMIRRDGRIERAAERVNAECRSDLERIAANVLAPAFVKMYAAWQDGNTAKTFDIFAKAYPLIKACYTETNPTCVKYLLSLCGVGTETVRLPLGPVSQAHKQQVDKILADTQKNLLI